MVAAAELFKVNWDTFGEKKYIWLINGGKGAPGHFGCGKKYGKLVFGSSFMHFLGVQFLSKIMFNMLPWYFIDSNDW